MQGVDFLERRLVRVFSLYEVFVMNSRGDYSFSQVPLADIPRSMFDRSFCHKTTFDSGYLIPFYIDEVLPGDTFNVQAALFARLSTPIVPIMDNLYMDTFYFFVPLRLIWTNFQKFMGEQANPADSTSFVVPQTQPWSHLVGSLFDYFGVPTGTPNNIQFCAFWSRAYNLIWNQWFRDENLQNSVTVDTGDGPDLPTNYVLLRRGKRHDYFTSCLPWPQKGPGVSLPLGTTAKIIPDPAQPFAPGFRVSGGNNSTVYRLKTTTNVDPSPVGVSSGNPPGVTNANVIWDNTTAGPGLLADLSTATGATINSLRQAFQIQKLLERDARGGTRYIELVRSHFGVVSPDARLQRPEFLGGSSTPVIINPVTKTGSTDATSPQGHLAAYGLVGARNSGFSKSFVEHGVILGLVSVRADLTYQQGLPRMFSRSTRYDFYWPSFAHLGEQTVLNKEIYCDGTANDNAVFGYQERWAEYRYKPSMITGQFRSTYATPLDVWHVAQKFTALPTLGDTFIKETPPVSRIVAVTTEPQFFFDSHIRIKCARPMPTYSVPGLIDHF